MPARGSWEQILAPDMPIMNETVSSERAPHTAKGEDAARTVPCARAWSSAERFHTVIVSYIWSNRQASARSMLSKHGSVPPGPREGADVSGNQSRNGSITDT